MNPIARRSLWFRRLLLLPHVLIGALFIFTAAMTPLVDLFGIELKSEIVAKRTRTNSEDQIERLVDYSFEFNGVSYTESALVTRDTYEAMAIGHVTSVRVLSFLPRWSVQPGFPNKSALAAYDPVLYFLFLFWNVVLSIFVWKLYFEPWRTNWLLTNGVEANGTVLSMKVEAHSDGDKMYFIRIRYKVPAIDVENSSYATLVEYDLKTRVDGDVYAAHQEGDSIVVLFDPRQPRRATLASNDMFEILTNTTV